MNNIHAAPRPGQLAATSNSGRLKVAMSSKTVLAWAEDYKRRWARLAVNDLPAWLNEHREQEPNETMEIKP